MNWKVALDGPLRRLTGGRLYSAYRLPTEDLVAVGVDEPFEAIEEAGYEEVPLLAAAKEHPTADGCYDAGSYRRVPDLHEFEIVGDTALADWDASECQYHAHVWDLGHGIYDVACHYELRSSIFKPSFDLRRLETHYKPEWGEEKVLGARDPALMEALDR